MSKPDKKDYGEGFLYGDDLINNGVWIQASLKIVEVIPRRTLKAANGQLVDKVCLRFEKTEKLLALNETNTRHVALTCGSHKPEKWVGHVITVFPAEVEAFGNTGPSVRVKLPKGTPHPHGTRKWMGKDLTGDKVGTPVETEAAQ